MHHHLTALAARSRNDELSLTASRTERLMSNPHRMTSEFPVRRELDAHSDRRRWLALAVIVAAQFMVVLDVAIVNVALPSIRPARPTPAVHGWLAAVHGQLSA